MRCHADVLGLLPDKRVFYFEPHFLESFHYFHDSHNEIDKKDEKTKMKIIYM